ncbi:hypothetical protein Tco_0579087 [Tanacetum coccineum]
MTNLRSSRRRNHDEINHEQETKEVSQSSMNYFLLDLPFRDDSLLSLYIRCSMDESICYCGASRNAECSNSKNFLDKITVLEVTVEKYMNPEQHTVNSAALLHEVYNDMEKLDLE